MKTLLFIIATLLLFGTVHAEPESVKKCPAGSYDIGISKTNEPLCKLEPTGCPYGDSIPLNDVKCVAPKEYPPIIETVPYIGGGK